MIRFPAFLAAPWIPWMRPFCFTLRHNAATFDWELAAGGDATSSHHATHCSAFEMLASNPQIRARGATVRVFSADGGYERERTYVPVPKDAEAVAVSEIALASREFVAA
ncbi:hypothetical protein LDO31_14380 [Luteimonas sp. XNQY3]|nr:hypothetical protein [Luteimonas sp. XNQY3]MCD9007403.1 hypothetical protein [Luteimonas sp. XNQY3]